MAHGRLQLTAFGAQDPSFFEGLCHAPRRRLKPKPLAHYSAPSIPERGSWLRAVLLGHYRYFGVPLNGPALRSFRSQVIHRGSGHCDDEASAVVSGGKER
jgi:hypothetical protein